MNARKRNPTTWKGLLELPVEPGTGQIQNLSWQREEEEEGHQLLPSLFQQREETQMSHRKRKFSIFFFNVKTEFDPICTFLWTSRRRLYPYVCHLKQDQLTTS